MYFCQVVESGVASLFALAAYLPGLQGSANACVGTRRPCPPRLAHLPGLQTGTDKQGLPMPVNGNSNNYNPQSGVQNSNADARGVALVERLVGGKVNEIKGGAQSVTTVSYFTGNDPSKWKSNLSTYQVVDMGEVYKGVDLRLKAYGNNVEKLFTVRPDATPEAIKLGLNGAKALKVNGEGQLVAETELGPVKFTKPIAYQEIAGKRVEVAVDYKLHGAEVEEDRGAEGQGRTGNQKQKTRNLLTALPLPPTTKPKTSSSTPCRRPRTWAGLVLRMLILSPSTPVGTYM